MRIDVITIFPRYLDALRESLPGRAIADGRVSLAVHDLRDWATDRHRTVDDTPYGGGPGMVMKPDVWGRALDSVVPGEEPQPDVGAASVLIVPTPAGRPFTQSVAAELAAAPHLVFACGRYEGIDQRFATDAARRMPVREISIGDYVLNGGEVAVLVILEAVLRLVPGVLGNPRSAGEDSFADHLGGLLEAPSYTRPAIYRDLPVPEVLLGGNHGAIDRFRRDQSLLRTAAHRPDLLMDANLNDRDREFLDRVEPQISDPSSGLAD